MGISISHGVPSTRSALTISNLGQHLAHALTGPEWREIAHLFDGHLSVPVHTPPTEAGRIGDLLAKAANHRAMNPEWAQLATLLGDSANRAARAGQNWEWT
ncbi:DUF7739 domain-containing protein [Streptomyces capitiformicae]|uniref:DUF7739 domain-containing protein n=1 Tax=Streptomyces capitiformicae TaxID=2014920 RepID=A0A919L8G5_9ACTN|nr:hypothetical protein [Streptomyces capitiformicae]GHH87837.1 hypothetical protein GCM10017771_30660 [Streptomyces capitiformicae]